MVSEEISSPRTRRKRDRSARLPAVAASDGKCRQGGQRIPPWSVDRPGRPAPGPLARSRAAILQTAGCSYDAPCRPQAGLTRLAPILYILLLLALNRSAQGGAMTRSSPAVLLAATLLFAGILVGHNLHLFSRPVHEHADFAANSLLILRAKERPLLHGHYSRLRFYHPGPGILYFLAGSEWLLSDLLRVVPAPHNAHMLGQLLLNALLLGVAVTVIA